MIRFRFVTCKDPLSASIRWATDFWASHVEAVVSEGYLGAHADGGVLIRPVGYDRDILMQEEFVTLPSIAAGGQLFEKYLRDHIGEPYDFKAIFGFLVRGDLHDQQHVICSAFQTEALTASGFANNLPLHSWQMSPRDLRIFVAGIPGITVASTGGENANRS